MAQKAPPSGKKRGRPPKKPEERKPRLTGSQRRRLEAGLEERGIPKGAPIPPDLLAEVLGHAPRASSAPSPPAPPTIQPPALPIDAGDPDEDPEHAAKVRALFEKAGPPPLGDPLRMLEWGMDQTAITIFDVNTSKTIKAGTRRRLCFEGTRTLGIVGPRAIDKKKLREAIDKTERGKKKGGADGMEPYRKPAPRTPA